MKRIIATFFALSLAVPAFAGETGSYDDAQKARYKQTFTQLDTNQDKALSETEASAAGLTGPDFSALDKDGNDQLSQKEFMKLREMGSSGSSGAETRDSTSSAGPHQEGGYE